MSQVPDSILAFTKDDRVAAEELRRSLEILRDHSRDRRVAGEIGRVLDGRLSFRALTRDPDFGRVMAAGLGDFQRRYEEMSPEEKLALTREGQRQEALLRDELGIAPRPEPEASTEFRPLESPRERPPR